MSLIPRVMLTPSIMRITRKKIDVRKPPTLGPEHCAIDSSWPKVERLHTIAVLKSTNLLVDKVLFFALLDKPPYVEIVRRLPGTTTTSDMVVHAGRVEHFTTNNFITTRHVSTYYSQTHAIRAVYQNRVELRQEVRKIIGKGIPDHNKYDFIVLVTPS